MRGLGKSGFKKSIYEDFEEKGINYVNKRSSLCP